MNGQQHVSTWRQNRPTVIGLIFIWLFVYLPVHKADAAKLSLQTISVTHNNGIKSTSRAPTRGCLPFAVYGSNGLMFEVVGNVSETRHFSGSKVEVWFNGALFSGTVQNNKANIVLPPYESSYPDNDILSAILYPRDLKTNHWLGMSQLLCAMSY